MQRELRNKQCDRHIYSLCYTLVLPLLRTLLFYRCDSRDPERIRDCKESHRVYSLGPLALVTPLEMGTWEPTTSG